jgi:hypothetical protein
MASHPPDQHSAAEQLRPSVAVELDALVRALRPEVLTWVRRYGHRGASVVAQPEEIWTHAWTGAIPTSGGGRSIVVPLWTTDESPSDLSAELTVRPDGVVTLDDVHVM